MARSGRSGKDPWQAAEAAFKSVTEKAPDPAPRAAPVIPNAKEQVTLRLDRDVLEHFQADGAGWQERINAALRQVIGR
ncbi:MAG: BrnA antitoxin family protein [Alsobacter sp.]|jgi:uncharacterized protein (DUF4415 family)